MNKSKHEFAFYKEDISSIVSTLSPDKELRIIVLMVGPEGDLTQEEKNLIKQNNFIFCKLTPTVLRSFQAVTVGVGTLRSLL